MKYFHNLLIFLLLLSTCAIDASCIWMTRLTEDGSTVDELIVDHGTLLKGTPADHHYDHYQAHCYYDEKGRLLACEEEQGLTIHFTYDGDDETGVTMQIKDGHGPLLIEQIEGDRAAHYPFVMNISQQSEASQGHGIKEIFLGGLERMTASLSGFIERFSFWTHTRLAIQNLAEKILGPEYLGFAGFYYQEMVCGSYGEDEIHPEVRLTLINGMGNTHAHILATLQFIHESHGNTKIHYIFHPTGGWTHDLIYCAAAKAGYISPYAKHLAALWRSLLKNMGPDGYIYHYAHSIGGTDTDSAILLLTKEEQRRLHVCTIGSATFVPEGNLKSVINYANANDAIPLIFGYTTSLFNSYTPVVFDGGVSFPPLCDHALISGNYAQLLQRLGRDFLERYRP